MSIAKNIKPTTKNSPKVVTGKNPDNKDASVYAKPHTMSGSAVGAAQAEDAVVLKGKPIDALRPTIGNLFKSQPDTKTDGIKQRGHGAATKGFTSRGPLG
jgi:hypothetical protein